MSETLPVAVNRQELHDLEVPTSFETADSFVIAVTNHGEAVRVHVHLDEELSRVADVDTNNHYVEANSRTEIPVSVHGTGPARGKIKVVSGYGATTRWVDVRIDEPEDSGVVVDDDLAKPTPAEEREDDQPATIGAIAEHPTVPLAGLAAVAVLVAVVAALTFQSQFVVAGASIVVLAVLAAAVQLFR